MLAYPIPPNRSQIARVVDRRTEFGWIGTTLTKHWASHRVHVLFELLSDVWLGWATRPLRLASSNVANNAIQSLRLIRGNRLNNHLSMLLKIVRQAWLVNYTFTIGRVHLYLVNRSSKMERTTKCLSCLVWPRTQMAFSCWPLATCCTGCRGGPFTHFRSNSSSLSSNNWAFKTTFGSIWTLNTYVRERRETGGLARTHLA